MPEYDLMEYFVDPYPNCSEYNEYYTSLHPVTQQYINTLEKSYKTHIKFYGKHIMNKLEFANAKTDIDDYFEKKHKYCKHPKRSLCTLLKLQLSHLFY